MSLGMTLADFRGTLSRGTGVLGNNCWWREEPQGEGLTSWRCRCQMSLREGGLREGAPMGRELER